MATASAAEPAPGVAPAPITAAAPAEGRRLDVDEPVWVDAKAGRVCADGRIAARNGVLEMFACPAGTKEHESIVAVDAPAFLIHTGLLAIGAEPGTPVRFQPEFRPPTGTPIRVRVLWTDDEGEAQAADAQRWIRHAETGRTMDLPFVFAGSGFWTDPDSGRQRYLADGGDLVCVSNFGAAMLDVPVQSTQANAELLFEPFTERIPPTDTPVRLEFSVGGPEPVNHRGGPDAAASADPLGVALSTLAEVGVGQGANDEVRQAWRTVATAEPDAWPQVLRALSQASPLAENWLRSALGAAAQRAAGDVTVAESDALVAFLKDRHHSARSRRAAYEVLVELRPADREAWLDGLLDDPAEELRYDAVAQALDQAAALGSPEAALRGYQRALAAARSLDQIERAAEALGELGEEVRLTDVMGFVTEWRLIGPFDNGDLAGFRTAYPPERALDAAATYDGKPGVADGAPIGWTTYRSTDRLGEVDVNTGVGPFKSAVAYAWATVRSDAARRVEVRHASRNATKVWVNGELVGAHEVYHNGDAVDQYRGVADLRAGDNALLVKVCQNDQPQPWAQGWSFQLRLCDETGGVVAGVEPAPVVDE